MLAVFWVSGSQMRLFKITPNLAWLWMILDATICHRRTKLAHEANFKGRNFHRYDKEDSPVNDNWTWSIWQHFVRLFKLDAPQELFIGSSLKKVILTILFLGTIELVSLRKKTSRTVDVSNTCVFLFLGFLQNFLLTYWNTYLTYLVNNSTSNTARF